MFGSQNGSDSGPPFQVGMHGYPRVNVEKLHWLICISIFEDIWDPIEKVDFISIECIGMMVGGSR